MDYFGAKDPTHNASFVMFLRRAPKEAQTPKSERALKQNNDFWDYGAQDPAHVL